MTPTPTITRSVQDLRFEASHLLRTARAVHPDVARERQVDARRLGDELALSLWSRVRWRSLKLAGLR